MADPKYPRISVRIDRSTSAAIRDARPKRGEVARVVQGALRRAFPPVSDKPDAPRR